MVKKKKIRYPLEMSNGTMVNSLDDLKEHFDLEAVLGFYKNGKLLTWLNDRYLEDEAEAVSALDESAPDFQKQLCAIFGVEFQGEEMDLEEIELRQERLKRLRQFTDEETYIDHIDQVAFDQDDLLDLLDEGVETIYLCGEKFSVPASQKGKTYIGINQPEVKISGKYTPDNLEIQFEGCLGYQLIQTEKSKPDSSQSIGAHQDHILARDVCPVFRNQLLDSLEFTKFWFMRDFMDDLEVNGEFPIPVFRTRIERYLAQESGYLDSRSKPVSKEEKMAFFSNGMPDTSDLSDIDTMLIKDILNIKMSNKEATAFKHESKRIRGMISKYIGDRNFIDSYFRNKKLYPGSQDIFKDAAESGWFDKVPGMEIKRIYDENEFKYGNKES